MRSEKHNSLRVCELRSSNLAIDVAFVAQRQKSKAGSLNYVMSTLENRIDFRTDLSRSRGKEKLYRLNSFNLRLLNEIIGIRYIIKYTE